MIEQPVLWRNVDKEGTPGLKVFDRLEDAQANNVELTRTFWMCAPWIIQPLYTRAPTADAKDVDRYRWVRDSGSVELYVHNLPGIDNCKQISGDGLEAAIDAAIEQEGGE